MRSLKALHARIPSLLPSAVRDAVFPALRVVPSEEARQHIFRHAASLGMTVDDGVIMPSPRRIVVGLAVAFVLIMMLVVAVGGTSKTDQVLLITLIVLVLLGLLYIGLAALAAWWPVIVRQRSVRAHLSDELNWLGFTHCRHCKFNLLGRVTSHCPECGGNDAVVLSETAPYRSFHVVRQIHAPPEHIRQAFIQPELRNQWWPTRPDDTGGHTVLLCSGPQDQLVFGHRVKSHYTITVQISPMGDASCVSWLHTSCRTYEMCDHTSDARAVNLRLDRLAALLGSGQAPPSQPLATGPRMEHT
ncbi:MAG: hypothetical protein U0636_13030 [Phycisphaerales bacterium]